LISASEFTEMATHGPKIRDGVATHLLRLRREANAAAMNP
jgi:hypothetical protein